MTVEEPSWHPFLDWFDIWAGFANYTEDGRQVLQDGAYGVRLVLQQPEKIGPFFVRERPWEACLLNHLCILYDEGRYRMWYSAWPDPDDPAIPKDHPPGPSGNPEHICYAESTDGLAWARPELGLCEYGGSRANNILLPAGYFGLQCVFRDPSAAESEQYKAVAAHTEWRLDGRPVSKEEARKFRATLQEAGDAGPEDFSRLEISNTLRGAVSPDGLHWQRLEEPLLVTSGALDTQNIVAYDPITQRYVAYLRDHVQRRRAVRHCYSTHFHTGWSEPQTVFATDSQDPLDEDVYTPAYSRYPSGTHHLLFPSIYHRASDTVDIHLAVSRDGLNWTRPERRPLVDRCVGNVEASRSFGSLYASPGLLTLGEDSWGLAYLACRRNHNVWDWQRHRPATPDGEYWWAKWQRHRLVALEAPIRGRVTLVERPCRGRTLLVNFRTEPGGWLQFELAAGIPNRTGTDEPPPIPGFSFADCAPLQGDSLATPATWGGKSDLSALRGTNVVVRIKMMRAKLFALAI